MKIPVYYVEEGELGAISLVAHPAIETNFQLFSKTEDLNFSLNEEKRIAFGPAIVANKPLYRESPNGDPYYVVFTKEVIEKLILGASKRDNLTFNLEHSGIPIERVYIVESFISREGLQPIGYEDVELGSWFVSLKIENEEVWKQLKEGKAVGFSIEVLVTIDKLDPLDEAINSVLD